MVSPFASFQLHSVASFSQFSLPPQFPFQVFFFGTLYWGPRASPRHFFERTLALHHCYRPFNASDTPFGGFHEPQMAIVATLFGACCYFSGTWPACSLLKVFLVVSLSGRTLQLLPFDSSSGARDCAPLLRFPNVFVFFPPVSGPLQQIDFGPPHTHLKRGPVPAFIFSAPSAPIFFAEAKNRVSPRPDICATLSAQCPFYHTFGCPALLMFFPPMYFYHPRVQAGGPSFWLSNFLFAVEHIAAGSRRSQKQNYTLPLPWQLWPAFLESLPLHVSL